MNPGDKVLVRFGEPRTVHIRGATVTYLKETDAGVGYPGEIISASETEYVVRLAGSTESVPKAWVTPLR